MPLDGFLHPLIAETFRHIPGEARYDVLDFRFAGAGSRNRWNTIGERTLYLAGDRGVSIAEFARHFDNDRPPAVRAEVVERRLYRLMVHLSSVLDLRRADVCDALTLEGAPNCFLDLEVARATARFIRVTTPAQAILVPSVAFLDDLSRWNLVVFLEKVPSETARFITGCEPESTFSIGS